MKSIRISSHTQRNISHLSSWWKPLTNYLCHSYSGQAIALPGDIPALVLPNLLLYRKNFLIFLNKPPFPFKKALHSYRAPGRLKFYQVLRKLARKSAGLSWLVILGGILSLALIGCSSLKSEVGWEIQLFRTHNAMKLHRTQTGSMWSQLHVYTEQTGATGLKNNQKGVKLERGLLKEQRKTWAAHLSLLGKRLRARVSRLHLLFFLMTNE